MKTTAIMYKSALSGIKSVISTSGPYPGYHATFQSGREYSVCRRSNFTCAFGSYQRSSSRFVFSST